MKRYHHYMLLALLVTITACPGGGGAPAGNESAPPPAPGTSSAGSGTGNGSGDGNTTLNSGGPTSSDKPAGIESTPPSTTGVSSLGGGTGVATGTSEGAIKPTDVIPDASIDGIVDGQHYGPGALTATAINAKDVEQYAWSLTGPSTASGAGTSITLSLPAAKGPDTADTYTLKLAVTSKTGNTVNKSITFNVDPPAVPKITAVFEVKNNMVWPLKTSNDLYSNVKGTNQSLFSNTWRWEVTPLSGQGCDDNNCISQADYGSNQTHIQFIPKVIGDYQLTLHAKGLGGEGQLSLKFTVNNMPKTIWTVTSPQLTVPGEDSKSYPLGTNFFIDASTSSPQGKIDLFNWMNGFDGTAFPISMSYYNTPGDNPLYNPQASIVDVRTFFPDQTGNPPNFLPYGDYAVALSVLANGMYSEALTFSFSIVPVPTIYLSVNGVSYNLVNLADMVPAPDGSGTSVWKNFVTKGSDVVLDFSKSYTANPANYATAFSSLKVVGPDNGSVIDVKTDSADHKFSFNASKTGVYKILYQINGAGGPNGVFPALYSQ